MLSEYPLLRIRLYDPQKGKEEFRVLSFERDLKQKNDAQKFVIVDRTDPKSRKMQKINQEKKKEALC